MGGLRGVGAAAFTNNLAFCGVSTAAFTSNLVFCGVGTVAFPVGPVFCGVGPMAFRGKGDDVEPGCRVVPFQLAVGPAEVQVEDGAVAL